MKLLMKPLSEEEAKELGIVDRMLTTLKMAVEKLKEDVLIKEALGEEIFDKYVKIKTREEEVFSRMVSSERRKVSMRHF